MIIPFDIMKIGSESGGGCSFGLYERPDKRPAADYTFLHKINFRMSSGTAIFDGCFFYIIKKHLKSRSGKI